MSEMVQALKAMGSLGLHVSLNPAGTYSFVGNVPVALGHTGPADKIEIGLKHGFGLVRTTVKCRTWPTAEAAWNEAAQLGYARCPIPDCTCNTA